MRKKENRIITPELIRHYAVSLREQEKAEATMHKYTHDLARSEYIRLIRTVETEGNERLSLVIQTICATGIWVSELRFITAEAVRSGRAEISSKGKRRTVFLLGKLCILLKKSEKAKQNRWDGFCHKDGKAAGSLQYLTGYESPVRKCKCKAREGVSPQPAPSVCLHLLPLEKDLSRLADILGHSNVNTTRIYMVESGGVHVWQIQRMGLVLI